MTNIDKINQIDFESIMQILGVRYIKRGSTLSFYEGDKVSDWWKADINKWIVSDFSWKNRPSWDRIEFISKYLSCSTKEAIEWFEGKFWLEKSKFSNNAANPVKEKRENLWELTNIQIKYLESRWIDYSSLAGIPKNYNWNICLPIKSIDWNIKSLQSRSIDDSKSRYYVERNTDSDWILYHNINKEDKRLIVVEWFTDYLTLRQYTTNVVGLINAKNQEQIKYIKTLSRKYDIYFCPDNDDAGRITIDKFKELGIKHHLFELDNYWVKDINELLNSFWLWDKIVSSIFEESKKPITNLSLALNKAKELKSQWVMLFWDDTLDEMTWWLLRGSTLLINWPSWQGKTTLSRHMLRLLLDKHPDKKIVYYSLETNVGRQIMQLIWFIKWVSEIEVFNNIDYYSKFTDELKHLELYDDIRSIEDIQNHITDNAVDIAFVDYAQKVNIEWAKDEIQKMITYAQDMQDFVINNWRVALISLSQTAWWNYNAPILERLPKNSSALREASDTFINVWKEDWAWKIWFVKAKNIWAKWWYKTLDTNYNPSTWEYMMFNDYGNNNPKPKFNKL